MYADIHLHSTFSDSTLSVEKIVAKAIENKISLISVCDHHSIDCYLEIKDMCTKYRINYIYGVEINASIKDDDSFVHILAYNSDPKNKKFLYLLESNKKKYDKMSYSLVESVSNDFDRISINDYMKYVYTGKFGGWKAYEYLLESNIISQLQEYFKLLESYKIKKPKFESIKNVCSIIKKAGGVAVLAHPGNTFPKNILLEYLKKIHKYGIEGIECFYPRHDIETIDICLEYCSANNLLITGGSDDHGEFMKNYRNEFDGMHNFRLLRDKLYLGNIKIY